MTLLLVLFCACISIARGLCPAGSVQGVSANDCYIYSLKPKFWFEADIECKSRYGGALAISLTFSFRTRLVEAV